MIRVTTEAGIDIYINSKLIISFGYDQRNEVTWVQMSDAKLKYRLTTTVDRLVALIKEVQ